MEFEDDTANDAENKPFLVGHTSASDNIAVGVNGGESIATPDICHVEIQAAARVGKIEVESNSFIKRMYGISFLALFVAAVVVFQLLSSSNADHTRNDVQTIKLPTIDKEILEKVNPYGPLNGEVRAYREKVNRVLDAIYSEWDIENYPLFLSMMHIPELSWKVQRAKFVRLILDNHIGDIRDRKFKFPKQSKYVLGFTGSSVTAGHDNFFNESFPFVMERRISSVFKDLFNITVVTRNHALGNNPCYPYDACVATHVGEDVDFLAWEQSMNCGHDEDPLEMFARSALVMKSKPTVAYLLSGTPFWTPDDCKNKKDAFGLTKETRKSNGNPMLTVKEAEDSLRAAFMSGHKYNIMKMTNASEAMHTMTFLYHTSTSMDGIPSLYAENTPMAQTVNAAWDYACMGPYGDDFGMKTLGGGSNWHPGVKGHKLRGDVLAYFLLKILDDALHAIDSMQVVALEEMRLSYHGADQGLSKAASRSVNSRSLWDTLNKHEVSVDGPNPTQIAQFNRIKSNHSMYHQMRVTPAINMEIRSVVVSMITSMVGDPNTNPQEILKSHKPVFCDQDICSDIIPECYTDYEPRVSHGFNELIVDDILDYSMKWKRVLSFFDAKAVAKGVERGMGYIDRKYIYLSQGINSTLSFYIHPHASSIAEDMGMWKRAHPAHANSTHGPVSDIEVEETSPLRYLRNELTGSSTGNTPFATKLFLCEVQKGFLQYPEGMDDLISAEVYINYDAANGMSGLIYHNNTIALHKKTHSSSYLQRSELVRMKPFKDYCYESVDSIRAGKHIVTIKQSGPKQVNLAYVLFK